MLVKLAALAFPLINLAHAGIVFDYYCSAGAITNSGFAIQQIAYHTFFQYGADECPGSTERSFDAFSGPTHPLLGFKEYCGGLDSLTGQKHSDRFCANVDLIGEAGLHVSIDGHDVALGASKDTTELDPSSDEAKTICKGIGLEATSSVPLGIATINVWWDVPAPICV